MSLSPISPAAASLRAQAVGAVEAAIIATVGQTPETEAPPQTARNPLPDPVQQAVVAARTAAAGRQAGLAPLFGELRQALASPALPPKVRAAVSQLLSLQLPASAPLTGEAVRQAVTRSGLFLEAHLAATQVPPPDLKAALLVLRQLLTEAQPDAPTHGRAAKTPPPTRDGALGGQSPATASLPRDADLASIAGRLGGDVDQAVARQVLHQLASLPQAGTSAWMFELPLATPQGTAIAQFEIDQDGHAGVSGEIERTWRVRFSLDVEPLGPVHVQLGAGVGRAAVTIWAEREDSLERLRMRGGELAGSLPADVVFYPGAPRRAPPHSGQLTDQSL
ncbi:MAG: hypothetical protein JWR84_2289 [Caulobacter sp.]|nr:hypothetical protein [Caulobacter sp.]